TLARVAMAQERYAQALDILHPLQQAAAQGQRQHSLIGIAVLQALARQQQGQTTQALTACWMH
ncbi:MAG: hypothetical protein HC837_00445, partial [Chloroflexaceae bacterium]|nr:hypothetical protein [Chloroflexaceae bacterium]